MAKNKKQKTKRSNADGESDDDDDFLESMMYQKKKSLPGQLANCETCSKRFTVTPYSKTGPDGGLLCVQCSKRQTAEEKKAKTKARKPSKRGRRQNFSNLLDGIAQRGAFSLLEMCIKVWFRIELTRESSTNGIRRKWPITSMRLRSLGTCHTPFCTD